MKKIVLDEHIAKLILQMYKNNVPINSIVNELGIGRRIVERLIIDNNLLLQTKSQLIKNVIPELKNKSYLHKLYCVDNMSIDDMATYLKTNQQVIKTAMRECGIQLMKSNEKRLTKHTPQHLRDPVFLTQEYVTKRRSVSSIADEFSVSSTLVKNCLKLNNISRRTHKEQAQAAPRSKEKILSARIARNLRSRLCIAVKGNQKVGSAVSDLGCSIEEFKKHLESKFEPGMTWDNYTYTGWHIDHIIPLDLFDLTDTEQFRIACHYTNLQPLWAKPNFQSSNKLKLINKVSLYLVCGPAGSGKSYVCNAVSDKVTYVPYDRIPKEEHMLRLSEAANRGENVLYDPFRKPITIMNRYSKDFNVMLLAIVESEEVIQDRILKRGGTPDMAHIRKAIGKSRKWAKNATFSGTSDDVLAYLKKELAKS